MFFYLKYILSFFLSFCLSFLFTANGQATSEKLYDVVEEIKYNIYRNDKLVGDLLFTFEEGDDMVVTMDLKVLVKIAFITFDYHHKETETFDIEEGFLKSMESQTDKNGDIYNVNISRDEGGYNIEGSEFGEEFSDLLNDKGYLDKDFSLTSWWDSGVINKTLLVHTETGRMIPVDVTLIGMEQIENERCGTVNANHWHFKSSKGKKFIMDAWYINDFFPMQLWFSKNGKFLYELASYKLRNGVETIDSALNCSE